MRAGLKKTVRTVRGKHGMVRRTYWVRAQDAAKRVSKYASGHKKAVAGALAAAALVGGAVYGNRKALTWAGRVAKQRFDERTKSLAGDRSLVARMHAAAHGAHEGWSASAKQGGTLSTQIQRAHAKHWADPKGRAHTLKNARLAVHKALTSDVASDLVGHFGSAAGAAMAFRGKGSMQARTARAAVGGIIGNHVAAGIMRRVAKRTVRNVIVEE